MNVHTVSYGVLLKSFNKVESVCGAEDISLRDRIGDDDNRKLDVFRQLSAPTILSAAYTSSTTNPHTCEDCILGS